MSISGGFAVLQMRREGKSATYTRCVGLDRNTNKELLFAHIQKSQQLGAPFYELEQVLPSLTKNQITVLLRQLRDEGKIICRGRAKTARWFESFEEFEN